MGWLVAAFGGICVVMGTSTPKPGDPQWQYAAAVAAGVVFVVAGLIVEYLSDRAAARDRLHRFELQRDALAPDDTEGATS